MFYYHFFLRGGATLPIAALFLSNIMASSHIFSFSAGAGGDAVSGSRADTAIERAGARQVVNISSRKSIGGRSPALEIRAGYLYRFSNNWSIGPEILGGWAKSESRVVGRFDYLGAALNQYEISQKLGMYAAIHARGGYFFNSWFVYGLVGAHLQSIRWQLNVHQDGAGGDLPTYSFPSNKYKLAPCLGVGFHKAITSNIDIGLELKTTFFQRYKLKWESFSGNAHNIHSSFKNTLYSARLKFTYNL